MGNYRIGHHIGCYCDACASLKMTRCECYECRNPNPNPQAQIIPESQGGQLTWSEEERARFREWIHALRTTTK